jgi:putative copper resistance protein D
VAWIIDLYGFAAVVLRGLILALEALTVGGVIFLTRPMKPENPEALSGCRTLLKAFAFCLFGTALSSAALLMFVLGQTTPNAGFTQMLGTSFIQAQMLIAATALLIALQSHSDGWGLRAAAALALVGATLLTSHAYARLDGRAFLLACTGGHHLAVAAWVGGLPYLFITIARGDEDGALGAARRFSRIAMASVALLALSGFALSTEYIGDWSGLYGTAYGIMLVAKIIMLGLMLTLGGTNFLLLRGKAGIRAVARLAVRRSVEVEIAIGITTILAAASMTSQPPAVDLSQGRVTGAEIVERFTPHWPRMDTPSPQDDIGWSESNHHWSGVCVFAMGVFALIARRRWGKWARNWPLVFLILGAFLLIRADSEAWPLGERGFWESFSSPDVMQHRIFIALIAAFALFERRVAVGKITKAWQPLIFPGICMLGGGLLFTHTHALVNIREEMLAEMSHLPIAIFGVIAAGARWLEIRLPKASTAMGLVWPACFVVIGVTLVLYRES